MSKLIIVKVFAEFYEKYNGCECGKCNARINGTEQMKYQFKVFFIFFFFFLLARSTINLYRVRKFREKSNKTRSEKKPV